MTVHNSNTLRLQQIYKDDVTISNSVKICYCIEGKCNGFQVHPSNEYLLILSNIGYLYVFKLINGELRLKVGVPSLSKNLVIDPSGLYAIISAHVKDSETKNLGLIKSTRNNLGICIKNSGSSNLLMEKEIDMMYKQSHEKEKTKVMLIEIGTGQVIGCASHIFNINSSGISPDGKFFSLGSKTGHVGIWAIHQDFQENICEVLLQMKLNPKFWNDYPIIQENKGGNDMVAYIDQTEDSKTVGSIDNISHSRMTNDNLTGRDTQNLPVFRSQNAQLNKLAGNRPNYNMNNTNQDGFLRKSRDLSHNGKDTEKKFKIDRNINSYNHNNQNKAQQYANSLKNNTATNRRIYEEKVSDDRDGGITNNRKEDQRPRPINFSNTQQNYNGRRNTGDDQFMKDENERRFLREQNRDSNGPQMNTYDNSNKFKPKQQQQGYKFDNFIKNKDTNSSNGIFLTKTNNNR